MGIGKKKVMWLANIGMIFTALIWGFAFVVVKDSVDSIPPVYMLSLIHISEPTRLA